MDDIGFIILRHVTNELTNKYWNTCYICIRKFYKEYKILIIDDNSNYEYVKSFQPLYKTLLIQSEYERRGELLPYYYYLHNKLFNSAVIIHDSVFINSYIDFNVTKYKFIWDFENSWDKGVRELEIISLFNNNDLINFYENKQLWKGCFRAMIVIKHDYLVHVNNKYDISILLNVITSRDDRSCFERIIACLLDINNNNIIETSLFGNIYKYCSWGVTYDNVMNGYGFDLPIIKVWTGR